MTSTRQIHGDVTIETRLAAAEARLADVETGLATALKEVARLDAAASIHEAVLRFCRGLDRLDRETMESVFLPDATVDYGEIFQGPVAEFLDATISHQAHHTQVQHLVGNVLTQVDGDRAVAESYELAHHTTLVGDGKAVDFILAMRTLDEFEKVHGEWRIRHRVKVSDWSRTWTAQDPPMGRSPLSVATRDTTDRSYPLFTRRR